MRSLNYSYSEPEFPLYSIEESDCIFEEAVEENGINYETQTCPTDNLQQIKQPSASNVRSAETLLTESY